MSLVRQDGSRNLDSECGEDLTRTKRISYMSERDADCMKERYVRVAAIIIATIEGAKNNCV